MNRPIVSLVHHRGLLNRSSLYLALIALMGCIVCIPRVGYARSYQITDDQPDKSSVQGLLDDLDDIDFVRSLTPLKLTSDQIDKLATAISDAKTKYDKKIADLSMATVGEMAEEIHKRHKEAVAGGPVSDAFDTKVRRVMKDFYDKRDVVNADNILAMSNACAKILTAEQQKIAAQLERDTNAKLGTKLDPKNPDSKFFNLYVVNIFINYRRIVPLLKDMKPSS